MKRKVVYNACYGGFSLSKEAVLLARKISGQPRWARSTLVGEKYPDSDEVMTAMCGSEDYACVGYGLARHDEALVSAVETLGGQASGTYAELKIAEVEGPYMIEEYDGMESVVTPDGISWN